MGNLQKPEFFNMDDLYLNVRLKTCIDGSAYDFTGRKTFDTSFYTKNIGFGITDISIEINPSLQPLIDITFKDLYGNTLFGTQRASNDSIDSSVLFNWPPPKFIFTFKGYLGRSVTWILNLKTTNVSYVPSDGSYEVKCSFVPNQWGFLADIPVLYLLACKKLRYVDYGNKSRTTVGGCIFESDSVFSYTRIGKHVETKTNEESKDFELLKKQLTSIKYGLANAVFVAKTIKLDEPITGLVNNIQIKGFTNLVVSINAGDKQKDLQKEAMDSKNLRKLDTYLQLNVRVEDNSSPTAKSASAWQNAKGAPVNTKEISGGVKYTDMKDATAQTQKEEQEQTEKKGKLFEIVNENLALIEDEIKRRIFSSTKSEISKLTIGEVFRQIARDSGFILGSILQAGFDGYYKNKASRDSAEGKRELIGNCFPLWINGDGEEVPAMQDLDIYKSKNSIGGSVGNISLEEKNRDKANSYGVASCEMDFVERFIGAVGEGIAENLLSDDAASEMGDKIKNRINNLEAIQPNPYKPFYENIIENILIRSGIIAYITRSKDPNKPGDYPKEVYLQDDGANSIITLTNLDMENLTKDIITQLSFEDQASLKRFCTFFNNLISDDGDAIHPAAGGGKAKIGEWFLEAKSGMAALKLESVLLSPFEPVPHNPVLTWPVYVNGADEVRSAIRKGDYAEAEKVANNLEPMSLYTLFGEILTGKKVGNTGSTTNISDSPVSAITADYDTGVEIGNYDETPLFYNTSAIDPITLTAINVKNNGLYWVIPKAQNDKYYYVLFDNPSDVSKTKEINVPNTTTPEDFEGKGFLNTPTKHPIGFIPIDTYVNKFNKEGDVPMPPGEILVINERIAAEECLNYSKCKTYYRDYTNYLQPTTDTVQYAEQMAETQVPAESLSYTIYTNTQDATDPSRNLVFGPFNRNPFNSGDRRSLNQRIAIKTMCKAILKKFGEIETEKGELIASVFGKANESRAAIYKQMHTIFHQWQIIASTIQGKEPCRAYEYSDSSKLSLLIEQEFGMCDAHVERGVGTTALKDLAKDKSTLFVYDYPLAPVNGKKINVKHSIINIEPLYKPNGNTTVLNIIQQICTKNNFVFVPFPGDANSDNINEIYKPYPIYKGDETPKNYFHVLFSPTPETRTKLNNNGSEYTTDYMRDTDFENKAISISFGSVNNQIVKSIGVSTDSTKPTAESILNLQRLVDKENTNQKVSMDCSMLPIYEGRSYKAKVDMIGNAQVYPMQYFYIQTMPMFGGLHQIMKVTHNITPNDMTTSVEGIRMRFSTNGSYGGIPPVTLEDLQALGDMSRPLEQDVDKKSTLGLTGETRVEESTAGDVAFSDMTGITFDESGRIKVAIFNLSNSKVTSGFVRTKGFWYTKANGQRGEVKAGDLHGGVDLKVPSGTLLYSPFDGTINFAGDWDGFGGHVQVTYKSDITSNFMSLQGATIVMKFSHCKDWLNLKRGDKVKAGQPIAISGGNLADPHHGSTTAAHLHFELSINGKLVDPLKYLNFIGVTLTDNDKRSISNISKPDNNIRTPV